MALKLVSKADISPPAAQSDGRSLDILSFLNPAKRAIAGGLVGLTKDPIVRFGMEQLGGEDFDDKIVNTFSPIAGDSTAGKVGEFVGEYGPSLVGGMGAFSLGRTAATQGAARIGALGMLGKQGQRIAARNLYAGEALQMQAIGGLEKAVRSLGGSVGLGAFEGARELAAGAEMEDALKSAAKIGMITLAFEGALIGAGSLAGASRARVSEVNQKPLRELLSREKIVTKGKKAGEVARDKKGNPIMEGIIPDIESLEAKRERLVGGLSKALKQNEQAVEAARSRLMNPVAGEGGGATLKQRLKDLSRAQKEQAAFLTKKLPQKAKQLPEMEKKAKLLANQRQVVENALSESHFMNSARGYSMNPQGASLEMQKIGLKAFTTPESYGQKLGGVYNRLMHRPMQEADQAITVAREQHEFLVADWFNRTAKNVGVSQKAIRNDPRAFLGVQNAWESGGDDGVRAYMKGLGRTAEQAEDQVKVWAEWRQASRSIAKTLEDMGAQPLMTADDLARNKVAEHFPHALADKSEAEIRAALAKRYGEAEADRIVLDILEPGLAKYGSFDFNRVMRGSLKDKLDDPAIGVIYESNPFVSMLDYLNRGRHRIEYGQRFGLNGELKDAMLKAVEQDAGHGAKVLASNIVDQVLGRKYMNEYWREWSKIAVNYQIATKLGMAVFPNMGQGANTIAFGGMRNNLKGLSHVWKKTNRKEIEHTLGFFQGIQTHITQAGKKTFDAGASVGSGGRLSTASQTLDRLAYQVLTKSGFTRVEAWNQFMAGAAGRQVFMDDIFRIAEGRLRGVNFDVAMRRLNSMGVGPDEVHALTTGIKNGGRAWLESAEGAAIYGPLEHRAIYRAAQITQFKPGSLRRPALWTHPVGKAIFQFKSFALNQGRFMKDQVLAEAAAGNMKPLAHVLSIYPVAAEFMVGPLKSIAKQKERDKVGWERVTEDFMMTGGIGIASDLYQSAQWGGLLDAMVGPSVGDATALMEQMARGDVQGMLRDFANQPTMKLGRFMTMAGAGAAYEAHQALAPKIEEAMDRGELLLRSSQQSE